MHPVSSLRISGEVKSWYWWFSSAKEVLSLVGWVPHGFKRTTSQTSAVQIGLLELFRSPIQGKHIWTYSEGRCIEKTKDSLYNSSITSGDFPWGSQKATLRCVLPNTWICRQNAGIGSGEQNRENAIRWTSGLLWVDLWVQNPPNKEGDVSFKSLPLLASSGTTFWPFSFSYV